MNNQQQNVYYSTIQHNTWTLHLAATERGLCCLTLPNESIETLQHWVELHIPGAQINNNPHKMEIYQQQISQYLRGERKTFTFPLDLRGTAFQISVWQALTAIPYAQTRSYSEIATALQHPKAVRAVGAANGSNPIPIVVPCHRVIGKNGTLTGFRGGLDIKAALLHLEEQAVHKNAS